MNRRGVTLIELLMAVIIGGIAFFALAMPFIAERVFWGSGNRQTEAQRDAHMVMRAIGRVARESSAYGAVTGFTVTCGTATFAANAGQLQMNRCGELLTLVDGVQSQVAAFSITPAGTNMVTVQLRVTRFGGQEDEQLQTQLYLRNAL
jgi:prepilin-type N-terminal cleavage/methylation domain-containing protein